MERPSNLGEVILVFAIPESSSRAEETPRKAEESDEWPR